MESFLNYIDYCTTSDFVLKICTTINPEINANGTHALCKHY